MAFPTSPTNGQIYIKGSTPYIYSSADKSWTQTTDSYLNAGNIRKDTTILGVTGTFPNDGDAVVGDVRSGKTFYSNDASRKTGTLNVPTVTGSYYITSGTIPLVNGSDTPPPTRLTYSFNIGNTIFCPSIIKKGDGYGNYVAYLTMLVIKIDESSFPVMYPGGGNFQNVETTSIWIENGKYYVNFANGNHYYFDTSNNTWSTYIDGTHTTGTQLYDHLILNGLKYEPWIFYFYVQSGGTGGCQIIIPVCKVSKV